METDFVREKILVFVGAGTYQRITCYYITKIKKLIHQNRKTKNHGILTGYLGYAKV